MSKQTFLNWLIKFQAIESYRVNYLSYDGIYNKATGAGGWWFTPFQGPRKFLGANKKQAVEKARQEFVEKFS